MNFGLRLFGSRLILRNSCFVHGAGSVLFSAPLPCRAKFGSILAGLTRIRGDNFRLSTACRGELGSFRFSVNNGVSRVRGGIGTVSPKVAKRASHRVDNGGVAAHGGPVGSCCVLG